MYGWLSNGGGIDRHFSDTKLPDVVLRSEAYGNVIIGNGSSSGTCCPAAAYVENNQLGLGGRPSMLLDVHGSATIRNSAHVKELNIADGQVIANASVLQSEVAHQSGQGFRRLKAVIEPVILEHSQVQQRTTVSVAYASTIQTGDWLSTDTAVVEVVAVTRDDAQGLLHVYTDSARVQAFHDDALRAPCKLSVYAAVLDPVNITRVTFIPVQCVQHGPSLLTANVLDASQLRSLNDASTAVCMLSRSQQIHTDGQLFHLAKVAVSGNSIRLHISEIDHKCAAQQLFEPGQLLLLYPFTAPPQLQVVLTESGRHLKMRATRKDDDDSLVLSLNTSVLQLQDTVRGMHSVRIAEIQEQTVCAFRYDPAGQQLLLTVPRNFRSPFPLARRSTTVSYTLSGLPVTLQQTSSIGADTYRYLFAMDEHSVLLTDYEKYGFMYVFGDSVASSGILRILKVEATTSHVQVYVRATHPASPSMIQAHNVLCRIIPFAPHLSSVVLSGDGDVVFSKGLAVNTDMVRPDEVLTVQGAASVVQTLSLLDNDGGGGVTHHVDTHGGYTISDAYGPRLVMTPDMVSVSDNLSVHDTVTAREFQSPSDLKLKQNVMPVDAASDLHKLLQISVPEFSFKSAPSVKRRGVIAQDIARIVPEAIRTTKDFCADICMFGTLCTQQHTLTMPLTDYLHTTTTTIQHGSILKIKIRSETYVLVVQGIQEDTTRDLLIMQVDMPRRFEGNIPCFIIGTYTQYMSVDYDTLFCMCVNSLKAICESK